jgi:hypothetical protein
MRVAKKIGMKKDNFKFLAAMAMTLILAGLVIYSSWQRDLRLAQGPVVDVKRIQELVAKGQLSLHEAEFYEEVKDKKGVRP